MDQCITKAFTTIFYATDAIKFESFSKVNNRCQELTDLIYKLCPTPTSDEGVKVDAASVAGKKHLLSCKLVRQEPIDQGW